MQKSSPSSPTRIISHNFQKNSRYSPNITPIQAGIWHRSYELHILDEGYDEWGLQAKEAPPGNTNTIKANTIHSRMRTNGSETPDLVNSDVEGAEAAIFNADYEPLLSVTNTLIIELHERNWPGISNNFHKAIGHYPFTSKQHGEYFIYSRKNSTPKNPCFKIISCFVNVNLANTFQMYLPFQQ